MKHGSLFSGIGGFDLAAEWMGWDNVFHCEWMPFPRKVLHHYWPEAISYEDVTKTDFCIHRGAIDILTGGFPCQPYSSAGKRLGKEDDRHLWPHMLRAIREIQPRWVVGENVRGLTNWNGGVVFDEVQADLESAGYEVLPFLLPAAAVNAPHRRDRIWFVAYAESFGRQRRSQQGSGISQWELQDGQAIGHSIRSKHSRCSGEWVATDAHSNGFKRSDCNNEIHASQGREYALGHSEQMGRDAADAKSAGSTRQCECRQRQVQSDRRDSSSLQTDWQKFPTQSPICGGDDGLPAELDGITFSKWRAESIKGYGNAIVPQVALQIFRAVEQYDVLL